MGADLPIHSGMPAPSPSSDPAALTTIPAVEAFLAGTPFASQSITDLTGGSANYAYRIHLTTPFDGHSTVVLKHAQPYVRTWTSLSLDIIRQVRALNPYPSPAQSLLRLSKSKP